MEIKVNVEEGVKTLVIEHRNGQALPLKEPVKIDINGTITAPGTFWEQRKQLYTAENPLDVKKCHALIDRRKRTIHLICDETNAYNAEVKGTIKVNPDLLEFGFNTVKRRTCKDAALFFKMNAHLFDSKEDCMKLVSQFKDLKYRITHEIEMSDDRKGNTTDKMVSRLNGIKLADSFNLNAPIFDGEENVKFRVEIELDVRDTEIEVLLVSQEYDEILKTKTDEIINRETLRLTDVVCLEV